MLWIDKHQTQFFPDLRFVIDVTLASGVTFTSGEGLLDAESVEEAEAAKRLRGGETLPEDWPVVSSIVRMPPSTNFHLTTWGSSRHHKSPFAADFRLKSPPV